jgi:phosphomannomutase
VVPKIIRKAGGVPRRERCGHTCMKKAMLDSKALVGGQLGGHLYFGDNFCCESGMITFARTVDLLVKSRRPLSKLIAPLQCFAHSGERTFHHPQAKTIMESLADRYGEGRIDYLDGITVQFEQWWFNVRLIDGQETLLLNLEAKNDKVLKTRLEELSELLGTPIK